MKHIIKAGCTGGVDMLVSYFLWLIRYSRKPQKYPLEKRYKKIVRLAGHVLRSLNVDFYVYGKENILNETSCYFPNHQSAFDALAILTTIPKPTSFVAKKEIYKFFMLGRAVRTIEGEFMDRDDLRQSLKVMNRVKEDLTNHTKNWVIFPEGTRNLEIIAIGMIGTLAPIAGLNEP